MKRTLTFLILLFPSGLFSQKLPTIIDSLICRLSINHPVVHLVGEDAIEKTYFFDSLGRNTLIKTVNFVVSEDTLEKVNLSSRQTLRLYKKIDFPESIEYDSVKLSANQIFVFYDNLNQPRETLTFNQVKTNLSGDTSVLSIIRKYRTQSFLFKNDSIVKFIDTFKLYRTDSMNKPIRVNQNTFYVKYTKNVIFITSEKNNKFYSIDLEKMKLKEHSMSYAYDKDIRTKFELLNEVYKRDYYKNSYQINFYNSKEEIPILPKKKRLKQYKKFHKSFPSEIQLR